jgi:transposase
VLPQRLAKHLFSALFVALYSIASGDPLWFSFAVGVGDVIAIPLDKRLAIWYNIDMAYSNDLRKRVVTFRKEGHTIEETGQIFKIGTTAIKRWTKQLSETGTLEKKALNRTPRKFHSEKLRAYMDENPLATLEQIAAQFGGSTSGASDALAREKITLKKRQ